MEIIKPTKITWQNSFILDVLRLTAAFVVFFFHGYEMWFHNNFAKQLVGIGHFGVVIFFVLSGYLISYTTFNNNQGIIYYAKARLSRLYSVLFPAILITAICQTIVYFTDKALYLQNIKPHTGIRYLSSLLFLSEIWFYSTAPAINGPLWSMSYEFWYYVIFGAWFFLKNSWKSYSLLILSILIAGPSILVMMPIWIMGCLSYKIPKLKLSSWKAYFAAVISFLIALTLLETLPLMPFKLLGQPPLYYANRFLKDSFVGLFVALSLWFVTTVVSHSKQPPIWLNLFRKIADLTFPLYLLHYPLLILWRGIFTLSVGNALQFLTAMTSILIIVTITGLFLERQRNWWNNLFNVLLTHLKKVILKYSKNTKPRMSYQNNL